jgi:hypothetical protein
MEEEPSAGAERPERREPEEPDLPPELGPPAVPSDIPPLPAELASGEAEVRRMVDAGAASPEELRALAQRLREQREREESAWRREVRPALIESKKKVRFSLAERRERDRDQSSVAAAAVVVVVVLGLLLVAAQTSVLVLLLPVAGVLVYAYLQGREP